MPVQATINCTTIVSKKLEKFLEQGVGITIYIDAIKGNRAVAQIHATAPDGVNLQELEQIPETSLIFREFNVSDTLVAVGDEIRNNGRVSGIFVDAGLAPEEQPTQEAPPPAKPVVVQKQPVVKTAAAPPRAQPPRPQPMPPTFPGQHVRPPDNGPFQQTGVGRVIADDPDSIIIKPVPHHMAQQKFAPSVAPHVGMPATTRSMNYDKLIGLLNAIPGVDNVVDPRIKHAGRFIERDEAIEFEKQLNAAPKLPMSVYLQNKTGGHFEIADFGVILQPNHVVDLSKYPAAKIKNSRDLAWCLKTGKLQFVDEQLYVDWTNGKFKQDDTRTWWDDTKVYSSKDEAIDNMQNKFGVRIHQEEGRTWGRKKAIAHEMGEDEGDYFPERGAEIEITSETESGDRQYVLPESEFGSIIDTMAENTGPKEVGVPKRRQWVDPRTKINPNKPKIKRTGLEWD